MPPDKGIMDKSRQYDLEELYHLRKSAKNGMEREKYEKAAANIMRENGAVRERREQLIKAVRSDDIRSIKRLNHELRMIQANQTYGKDY